MIGDRKPEQFPSKPRRSDVPYTLEEVAAHGKVDDGWIVVNSHVYDITNFVRHHPGWTYGGQTSTVLAIQRNLGKECTDEFFMIHSKKAVRQLDDYMIGYLSAATATSLSLDILERFISHLVVFLDACQDVLAVSSASQRLSHAVSVGLCVPRATHAPLWTPLTTARCYPSVSGEVGSRMVLGSRFEQKAVLLSPRLWGRGRLIPTQVEIVVERHQAVGCFSFGIVPESAFHKSPQGSRSSAHTFDGFGRLSVPGSKEGMQHRLLYGERVAEGDHLSLLMEPAKTHGGVQCSFLVNGRSLGIAFNVEDCQPHSPVLYFYPMFDSSSIRFALPQYRCAAEPRRGKVPEGLVFHNYGPDLTSWLDIPVTNDTFEHLTVEGIKHRLAQHLGKSSVSKEHLDILVDGQHVADDTAYLREFVHYRDGIHLETLHWHIPYLIS